MNQAIVDPEHLRQFAAHLHQFAEEMKQRSTGLASQMNQLEQTWRDEQLAEVVDEIAVYMIELADELQGRVSSLKKRELCRESSNGKHERNGASSVRR